MTARKHLKRRARQLSARRGMPYATALRQVRSRDPEDPMTASTDVATRNVNCSFCNKANTEVRKLIAGPGVYICDECVHLCDGILEDTQSGRAEAEAAVDRYENRSAEEILEGLPALARNVAAVESNLHRWVFRLRELGTDWASIASSLSIGEDDARAQFSDASGPARWRRVGTDEPSGG